MNNNTEQALSNFDAILVGVILLSVMGGVIALFGSDSLSGATQVAMMVIGFLASLIGLKNKISWTEIEQSIITSSSKTAGPILIFLAVGALIGSLMLSGAVPTLLYFGLNILSPSYFYPMACLICALVAICIGSSWTTAATIGVALIGVAYGFSLSPDITAGAVISGAYFGDKMSPLSETTNLAPSIAGSELFEHIRHMSWVSLPSFVISLTLFLIISLSGSSTPGDQSGIDAFLSALDQYFEISWINLLPVLLLLWLATRETPAFLAIMGVSLLACVFAVLFQYDALVRFAGYVQGDSIVVLAKSLWQVLYAGFNIGTGNQDVDYLLSRGGMASMVNMVWLVIASMMMTGVLERIGFIAALLRAMMKLVRSTGSLIATTMATCFGVNVLTGDQYMSIVVPGQMWKSEFENRKLKSINLSRALEDSGTLSSPLIPWNGCGVFMAGTLAVATISYLPYCFFNLINPIVALIFAFSDIKIAKIT
ncbi:MAG: NhaC family Na+:H+ antiporter [Cryomorphaceae bacterium]|jgi:NhaC family Na+:H+ antiporter